MNTLEVNMETITVDEVASAMKRLKNGKSAGIDGIQVELLKHGGEETTEKIQQLCNRIYCLHKPSSPLLQSPDW
jgi:hypothetical protein